MANNSKQCFNTHYQSHCDPTTKSLWLCSSVYCRPPHQSRRIWLVAAATNQKPGNNDPNTNINLRQFRPSRRLHSNTWSNFDQIKTRLRATRLFVLRCVTQTKQTQCPKFLGPCKARRVLDKETLRNVYFSFMYPYWTSFVHLLGNSAQTHLDHLQKLHQYMN